MKIKFAFLILNYNTYQETINCIKSIKENIDIENYKILVVDNCSYDKSGEKLKIEYKDDSKIKVIINDENYGFTKGNNVGYEYARNVLKVDYIVMINSDTYMIQKDFCEQIIEEYKNSNFAILGPKIHNLDNKFQMHEGKVDSINVIRKKILKMYVKLLLNELGISFKKNDTKEKDEVKYSIRKEDVVLHGCCLIFSQEYLKNFPQIPEKTKFYCEEEIIYLNAQKKGLKTVYNPNVNIFHLKSVATGKKLNSRQKNRFILINQIKANKVLIKEIKEKR